MKTFKDYIFQANENLLAFNYEKFEESFLTELLSDSNIDNFTHDIINLRTDAFKLQSFARVLRYCGDEDLEVLTSEMRDDAKFCEDAFGRFLYFHEMYCEVSPSAKIREESFSALLLALFELFEALPEILKKLNNIKSNLGKLPKNHLELKKYYLKGLEKELKKINKKIQEINPLQLEDGTHKLRRLIRWVIMHIIYPQGLFGFNDLPEAGPSQFLKLKPDIINKPVLLPYSLLGSLSSFVATLGVSKDKLLFHHYENELSGKKIDINKSDTKTEDLTKDIIDKIKSKKIIKKIRKEL